MIDEEGGISEVIQADVILEESCKNAVAKTVELWGAVHILVNIGTSDVMDVSSPMGMLTEISWRGRCNRRCHYD